MVKGERQLPPLNWGFLYGLMDSDGGGNRKSDHKQDIAESVLTILARQAPISTSAKKLVELALEEMSPKEPQMNGLMRNLPALCEAFGQCDEDIAAVKAFAVNALDIKNTELMISRLQILKALLSSSESDLELIEEPLANFILASLVACQVSTDERVSIYAPLLQVAALLPAKYLESLGDHGDEAPLTVSLDLRFEFARNSNPKETSGSSLLVWLNQCADAVANKATDGTVVQQRLYRRVLELATRERAARSAGNKQWLLELMGQSRAVSRAKASNEEGFRVLFQV